MGGSEACLSLQVAGISWLEKKAAAALFGTPPESTYEEALESLMKVRNRIPLSLFPIFPSSPPFSLSLPPSLSHCSHALSG